MICENCKVMPSQVGKTICLKCERRKATSIIDAKPSKANNGELSKTENFEEKGFTDREHVTGYLKSHHEIVDTDSIGLKILKSVFGGEDFSFSKKVQHFQVRTSNQELVYVIFPGQVKKNLVLTEGNKVEVIGHRNRHNQLIARSLNDLDSCITYKTSSFPYLVALFIILLYLILSGVVVWFYYSLFKTYIMPVLILTVLVVIPFKRKK